MALKYKNNQLHIVQGKKVWNLLSLVRTKGSPCYVYNIKGLVERFRFFKQKTAPASTHYAMKANSHPEVLKALCKEGAGVDVVSGGELQLALKAGFKGRKVVFSGWGKLKRR